MTRKQEVLGGTRKAGCLLVDGGESKGLKGVMKYLMLLVFVIVSHQASAQLHFVRQWDKTYGTSKHEGNISFNQSLDGGFIFGGLCFSGIDGDKTQLSWDMDTFYADYWVIKTDASGSKEWDKRFGSVQVSDGLWGIIGTADGGSLLTGNSTGLASGDRTENGKGGADYWIVKIDAQGNKQWDKMYGGTRDDLTYINPIQTRDGGYLIGGRSASSIGGDKTEPNRGIWDDYWIIKIDSAGNKQWDKTLGGPHDEEIKCLLQTSDGGYLIGGNSRSDAGGDKSEPNWDTTALQTSDYWVVKLDSLGNVEWDKTYGTNFTDYIFTILQERDGGYLIGGSAYFGISGDKNIDSGRVWIVKIDALGSMVWEKVLSVPFVGMRKTKDGGYLLYGNKVDDSPFVQNQYISEVNFNNSSVNSWVMKLDSNWNKQWDKTIFSNAGSYTLALQTFDNCYAIGSISNAPSGGYKSQDAWSQFGDYFILKFCMDTVTGINASSASSIGILTYPNPFTETLQIAITSAQVAEATFTITNTIGQLIYYSKETQLAPRYTKSLDLRFLPKGIYFIQVQNEEGEKVVERVVKE